MASKTITFDDRTFARLVNYLTPGNKPMNQRDLNKRFNEFVVVAVRNEILAREMEVGKNEK